MNNLYRVPVANADNSAASREELRKKLMQAERSVKQGPGGKDQSEEAPVAKGDDEEEEKPLQSIMDADDDVDESEPEEEEEEEESEDDDEEDTAELLRELAKIKKERAEEKERIEREKQEMEEQAREEAMLSGNPLLNTTKGPDSQALSKRDFSVKRRWDDDVVFRNQAKGQDERVKKRFINDLLRSDFHRKFMSKYVR
ncbi:hypothetical protein HDU67_003319 [Dinochytrium kinnereticum]|nr:hypothetical protein HDU67_003319 [Dinochytrium kinnereticum]